MLLLLLLYQVSFLMNILHIYNYNYIAVIPDTNDSRLTIIASIVLVVAIIIIARHSYSIDYNFKEIKVQRE